MTGLEDKEQIEYAALLDRARDAERMTFASWIATGIAAAGLLAWGIASGEPGFMVSVVMTAAAGFMAVSRWREQAASLAGYIEAFHESDAGGPAYHARLARLQNSAGPPVGRDWHATVFFNVIGAAAVVFAWLAAGSATYGELWAGVVTACALVFASFSVSENGRALQVDHAAQWRRSQEGPQEVKRRWAP